MAEDTAARTSDRDPTRLSEAECERLFDRLFPGGLAGRDVLLEVAPGGWAKSPLVRVFHPTLEQTFAELLDFHESLERLRLRRSGEVPKPPPTLEDARANWKSLSKPVYPESECAELVGMCVWDIFSDNHDVLGADGRLVDLGSFRTAAEFIAGRMSRDLRHSPYDYLDFYLGPALVRRRADLSPVYRTLFRRMRALGLDWIYCFPRLRLVTIRDPAEDDVPIEKYDPSDSIRREEERRREAEDFAKLEADLEEAHLEAVREARRSKPPPIVRSYRDEYGRLPRGWPPEA
jgi:hypothetical protein